MAKYLERQVKVALRWCQRYNKTALNWCEGPAERYAKKHPQAYVVDLTHNV